MPVVHHPILVNVYQNPRDVLPLRPIKMLVSTINWVHASCMTHLRYAAGIRTHSRAS